MEKDVFDDIEEEEKEDVIMITSSSSSTKKKTNNTSSSSFNPTEEGEMEEGEKGGKKKPMRRSISKENEKTISKSQIIKILKCQYYPCFYPSASNSFQKNKDGAIIVISDDIQSLKSFGSSDISNQSKPGLCKLTHFEHLSQGMRTGAEFILKTSRSVQTYVMVFDKYKYVPIAKGVEQTKRKGKVEVSTQAQQVIPPEDGIHFKKRRPYYIEPRKKIPSDWNLAIHDRRDTLENIIRCLCRGFFDKRYMDNHFEIPPGKSVIVDGHCLTLDDILELTSVCPTKQHAYHLDDKNSEVLKSIDFWTKCGFKDNNDVYNTPICIEKLAKDGRCIFYFLTPLRNKMGEADFAMFTLHKLLSKMYYKEGRFSDRLSPEMPYLPVDFYSIDSDIVYLALLYLDKISKTENILYQSFDIWVRYWPQLGWGFSREYLNPQYTKWVYINHLYKLIEIDPQFPSIDISKLSEIQKDLVPSPIKSSVSVIGGEEGEKQSPKKRGMMANTNISNEEVALFPKLLLEDSKKKQYLMEYKKLQFKCVSLITALITGGGDYTAGYYAMTYDKHFLAVIKHSNFINDIVCQQVDKISTEGGFYYTVDGINYGKFIQASYILASPNLFGDNKKPESVKLNQLVEKSNQLKQVVKQFPTIKEMEYRKGHLSYLLRILSQIGNVELYQPMNFEDYAFVRYDSKAPWSSDNILRLIYDKDDDDYE